MVLTDLNFSVFSAVNVHYNFSALKIPAADIAASCDIGGDSCTRSWIDGGIVLYIDLHISSATSNH